MKPARSNLDWQVLKEGLARAAQEASPTSPESARALLDERARALASVPPAPPGAAEALPVVTFALGDERYAVESRFLREIVRVADITPVPGAPDSFTGVTNVRGEILALVDLRKLFRLSVKGLTDLSRILVLGVERAEFGLLADSVHEVTTLRKADLLALPGTLSGIGLDYLLGVTADAVIAIDGEALLADPRLFVGSTAGQVSRKLEVP